MKTKKIISTNPAKNYAKIGALDGSSIKEINSKVRLAKDASRKWKNVKIEKRIQMLTNIKNNFLKNRNKLTELITKETGKPIKESRGEFDYSFSGYFDWFLNNAKESIQPEVVYKDKKIISKIVYEPYGVAAVIAPWNFPLEMFVWGVIPNLLVGNTVVMKHSSICALTGKLIEDIMLDSNLPKNIFAEIYGGKEEGEALAKDDIDLLWFTGSSNVGKHLQNLVSKKNKFVKCVMELGGSNPGIIFADADLDKAIETVFIKRFANNGQACNSLKRLIVHESIFNEVVGKIVKKAANIKVDDPESVNTDSGSLSSNSQLQILKDQMEDAIKKGAKIMIGGKQPKELKGAYYQPTVLTNIKLNMEVWKGEVFAPVLPVVKFKTADEAIKLANDTPYGLGSYVFGKDQLTLNRVSSELQAGMVRINSGDQEPAVPFGGYKMSGTGREHGKVGFQELCQIKSISSWLPDYDSNVDERIQSPLSYH